MQAWRRGLIKSAYTDYGLRGDVGRELVLYMMASEEDARQARSLVDIALGAYCPHITNPDKLIKFARKQSEIVQFSDSRAAFKRVSWDEIDTGNSILKDTTVQAMIRHFKYTKERGKIAETES